jgi:hypothetical protein
VCRAVAGVMRSCSKLAAVEGESFLAGTRHASATVAVVTTAGPAGRFGFTISAMSSVPAGPPSLLVGIHRARRAVAAIVGNAVNLLDDSQHGISDIFGDGEPRHATTISLRLPGPILRRVHPCCGPASQHSTACSPRTTCSERITASLGASPTSLTGSVGRSSVMTVAFSL